MSLERLDGTVFKELCVNEPLILGRKEVKDRGPIVADKVSREHCEVTLTDDGRQTLKIKSVGFNSTVVKKKLVSEKVHLEQASAFILNRRAPHIRLASEADGLHVPQSTPVLCACSIINCPLTAFSSHHLVHANLYL